MKRPHNDAATECVDTKKKTRTTIPSYMDLLPYEISGIIDHMVTAHEKIQKRIRNLFRGFETHDEMIQSTADKSDKSQKIRFELGRVLPGRFVPGKSVYVDGWARIRTLKPELLARKITRGSPYDLAIKFFQLGLHREMRDPCYLVIWSYDPVTRMLTVRDDPDYTNPGVEYVMIRK